MQLLLWSLIILFGIAVLIDKVMTEEGARAWRDSTSELRGKIDELEIGAATTAANDLFRRLFDAIYGEYFWSRRRFVRSVFSSLLALTAIVLLLDWESTIFGRNIDQQVGLIAAFIFMILINTCADYLSLQETRWVLGRIRESHFVELCAWAFFDLVATVFIYLFIFYIATIPVDFFYYEVGLRSLSEYIEVILLGMFLKQDQALPFFLSTFFTSALWFLFIASALLIRAMKRSSRVLRISLDTIAESDAPARTTAGIMAVVVMVGYGIAQALSWMVGF